MLDTKTLKEFAAMVSERTPTPGGGSVSGYVGALASALGSMVAKFSLNKNTTPEDADRLNNIIRLLDERCLKLVDLASEDMRAYDAVAAILKGPKEEGQREARKAELQKAFKYAMEVPLRGMRTCLDILKIQKELFDLANPNLLSDIGVGVLMAHSALTGCMMNVKINLASIKEDNLSIQIKKEIGNICSEADSIREDLMRKMTAVLK